MHLQYSRVNLNASQLKMTDQLIDHIKYSALHKNTYENETQISVILIPLITFFFQLFKVLHREISHTVNSDCIQLLMTSYFSFFYFISLFLSITSFLF